MREVGLGFSCHLSSVVIATVTSDGSDYYLADRRKVDLIPSSFVPGTYPWEMRDYDRRDYDRYFEASNQLLVAAEQAVRAALDALPSVPSVAAVEALPPHPPWLTVNEISNHFLELKELIREEHVRMAATQAANRAGIRTVRFTFGEVRSEAARALGWSAEHLETRLISMGRTTRPWNSDAMAAAAAAMLALATVSSR